MKTLLLFLFAASAASAQDSKLVLINPAQVSEYLQNGFPQSANVQIGKSNEVNLQLINDQVFTLQTGNHNEIYYHDSSALQSSEMLILQNGNQNSIQVLGNNSISENMQIHIKGNNRDVTIINHR